jgi:hypothetical protein
VGILLILRMIRNNNFKSFSRQNPLNQEVEEEVVGVIKDLQEVS